MLSPHVVTRQYRAPELLYGAPLYDANAVDIWAAACIIAEMFNRQMLFNGTSDIDQLSRIFALLGTPDDSTWPHRQLLPDYLEFEAQSEVLPLTEHVKTAPPVAVGLMAQMLQYHSPRRLSAATLLQHPFWKEEPLVARDKLLPPGLLG